MKLIFFLSVTVFLLPGFAISEVLVNETFDDGSFTPPYKYVCDIPEPAGCTNSAKHVTNVKRAGTHSLECIYNQAGAAGIKLNPSAYGHTDYGNNAHARIYFKHDSAFRFHERTKLFIWHKAGMDPYLNINGCSSSGTGKDVSGSAYGDISFYIEDTNGRFRYVSDEMASKGHTQADWVVTAGDGWWMVELSVDTDGDIINLWVMRPEDSTPTHVFNNVSREFSAEPMETLDVNWLNATTSGSGGKMWIDEVVISDQYIGPHSGRSSFPGVGNSLEIVKDE